MSNEIKSALDSLEARINERLKEANEKAALGESTSKESKATLDAMLKDHSELIKAFDNVKKDVNSLLQKGHEVQAESDSKQTLGETFVNSDSFKSFRSDRDVKRASVEYKNTVVNSGNNTSTHSQLEGVYGAAFRRLTVMPTLQMGATDSNILYYSRETTWSNNAAGQAEGSAKAESDWAATEVTRPVQTIAHFIKVSKQALDDSSFLASHIQRRMIHGINNKVEQLVITGDGVGPNISGWTAAGNSTATSPIGTGNIFGLAREMVTDIIDSDYEPSYFYFNPRDWAKLETTQRGTGDAAYVGASGAINYANNGLTGILWGVPVIQSSNVPLGTIFCKSSDADLYADRAGTVIEMFEQDGTNAQSNLVTVRAETRGALAVFAPTAIRTGVIGGIT